MDYYKPKNWLTKLNAYQNFIILNRMENLKFLLTFCSPSSSQGGDFWGQNGLPQVQIFFA